MEKPGNKPNQSDNSLVECSWRDTKAIGPSPPQSFVTFCPFQFDLLAVNIKAGARLLDFGRKESEGEGYE